MLANSKFDSIASIVNYLREAPVTSTTAPSPPGEILPATPPKKKTQGKTKQTKKKSRAGESSTSPATESDEVIQRLPEGRIKYGPITVNPRKEPSKTLFTGRRSKYEVLSADEEEKRRDRRERNRVAATKCREKRENVLHDLEEVCKFEESQNEQLTRLVEDLQNRRNNLEIELNQHTEECPLINNLTNDYRTALLPPLPSTSMIFGDPTFLSNIIETPAPPLRNDPSVLLYSEEEENVVPPPPPPLDLAPLDQTFVLTNSAYPTDPSDPQFLQQEDMSIVLTTSSLERLIIGVRSPAQSMDISNNSSLLVNSAQGASCGKQHSGHGEEEAMAAAAAAQGKPYVF